MSNIKFRLVGGLHNIMNAQYALFTKVKIEGFLVLLRGVAGFSNLRGLIVIECII